jgi:carbohydrate-selective porin OprB
MVKARHSKLVLLVLTGLCILAGPADAQTGLASESYLLGDWGGLRTRLVEQGVRFDFQYVSDTLWGFKSQQTPFAMWNRFRATVDIDFGALVGRVLAETLTARGAVRSTWRRGMAGHL